MDFASNPKENVFNIDLWKRQYDDHRQSVTLTHAKEQKWWYLSNHRTDEVTFIKIWDSKQQDNAHCMCGNLNSMILKLGTDITDCAHCAFAHPGTPKSAPPRESIEVRCVVMY